MKKMRDKKPRGSKNSLKSRFLKIIFRTIFTTGSYILMHNKNIFFMLKEYKFLGLKLKFSLILLRFKKIKFETIKNKIV